MLFDELAQRILLRLVGVAWLLVAVVRDPASADDDVVEVGGGEADPHGDLLADARHAGT